jgi:RNA recognition motif-containing protein
VFVRIAFIEYATEAEAAAAIETYNESDLDGRTLNVGYAGAKPEFQANTPDRRKIFVVSYCCYVDFE